MAQKAGAAFLQKAEQHLSFQTVVPLSLIQQQHVLTNAPVLPAPRRCSSSSCVCLSSCRRRWSCILSDASAETCRQFSGCNSTSDRDTARKLPARLLTRQFQRSHAASLLHGFVSHAALSERWGQNIFNIFTGHRAIAGCGMRTAAMIEKYTDAG